MNEVVCHIASYDAMAIYAVTWKLMALNLTTFGAIAGVALIVHKLIKGRKARRPYHV